MFNLILSWLPLLISMFLLSFVVVTLKWKPKFWGSPIAIVWFIGLVICVIAAVRDGYGFSESSVLSFTGLPATLFSIFGISATVVTVSALFVRNQAYRQKSFLIISLIFLMKLVAMEAIRFLA